MSSVVRTGGSWSSKEVVMIEPYVANLKQETKHNVCFRKVLFTGRNSQLVVMRLQPGEEIGTEVHEVDQLIYIVKGEGKVVLDGRGQRIEDGTVVAVPARTQHNVINTENESMQLFTVYAPPQHAPGTCHQTRADADAEEVEVLETQPV